MKPESRAYRYVVAPARMMHTDLAKAQEDAAERSLLNQEPYVIATVELHIETTTTCRPIGDVIEEPGDWRGLPFPLPTPRAIQPKVEG